MAEYSLPTQAVLQTCKQHINQVLRYYCFNYDCNKRICELCCKEDHKDHNWMGSPNAAIEIKQNSRQRCAELQKLIDDLVHDNIENKNAQPDLEKIEELRQLFKCLIDDIAERQKGKRLEGLSDNCLQQELDTLEKMHKFFDQDVLTANENVALEVEEEFHNKREVLHFLQERSSYTKKKFKMGLCSPKQLEDIFGCVVEDDSDLKMKVREIACFKTKNDRKYGNDSDPVWTIVPVGADHARVCVSSNAHVDHIDNTGKVIDELKVPSRFDDFIIVDNDIIYSHFHSKEIRRISPSGTISELCQTILHPSGMSLSKDGGIFVCLSDCNITALTKESKGAVMLIDSNGKTMRQYLSAEGEKDVAFISPSRVIQNINNDICVVDTINKKRQSRLMVLTLRSKLRFIYEGQPKLRGKFSLADVCNDRRGRIILTDYKNDAVHLLSDDGKFLKFLLTNKTPLRGPRCIALNDDTLWIGCDNGKIGVYKYTIEDDQLVYLF